ncbi:phenylacetate-CoA oxygenase subunit PaaJ [Kocuria sp. JC486]|uniref:Phenylacetate-CoA oxygenase subunit PaaJ n=2 Tax=Micrococcaceae TaxID=1268 RepID=A0A3N4AG16_9MICC|nr:1,2-phenylacetyl-CoA epoxidase subunit PaaD [Kocuria sp. JC486]NHU86013.1 phenylacetate-CoA oxygenase subunit PaaJ [Kocuria sp. JC486]ROZ65829.1 phenylacetate-CoA oxygenase subunit PaaJ [Kocuria soli]
MDFEQDPNAVPRPVGQAVPVRDDELRPADPVAARIWDVAATVNDPEIPVLSVADLGILREARADGEGGAVVVITPTYSGCPAMETITADLRAALGDDGFSPVRVETVLEPAWTTDWMTEDGCRKLNEYGIAPPTGRAAAGPVTLTLGVKCPRCNSLSTREMTHFGSTSCKSLWVCNDCLEPFDHFKVH